MSANFRFTIVLAVAVTGFLAVDHYLHAEDGFIRAFGPGSEEGQIQSKIARAPRMAAVADVIAFGSSLVRSGVSAEPFIDRKLVLWNFAVSGGGPLTDYFALSRIADTLSARQAKPLLLVELRGATLVGDPTTLSSEYPQYLGIVRTRREALAHAGPLAETFRGYGMTSQFISSIVIPSNLYRSHSAQLLTKPDALTPYFYGMEDVFGYSPLYTVHSPSKPLPTAAPAVYRADEFVSGKIEFLRRFLRLARSLQCPVVFLEQPSLYFGRDAGRYDTLLAMLSPEFGPLRVLRTDEFGFRLDDFDEGEHLNIRGSDRLTERLIDLLAIQPQPDFDGRLSTAFEAVDVPPLAAWQPTEDLAPAAAVLGLSPEMQVHAGEEYVFESRIHVTKGQLLFRMVWNDAQGVQRHSVLLTPPAMTELGETRVFLRGVPAADRIRIEVSDWSAATGGASSAAKFWPMRLWTNRS